MSAFFLFPAALEHNTGEASAPSSTSCPRAAALLLRPPRASGCGEVGRWGCLLVQVGGPTLRTCSVQTQRHAPSKHTLHPATCTDTVGLHTHSAGVSRKAGSGHSFGDVVIFLHLPINLRPGFKILEYLGLILPSSLSKCADLLYLPPRTSTPASLKFQTPSDESGSFPPP